MAAEVAARWGAKRRKKKQLRRKRQRRRRSGVAAEGRGAAGEWLTTGGSETG